jgi:4-hydroxybenzoate polyprenyltransferase
MSLGVLLWTAGFDIIYACQDEEFDRAEGLYSIPSVLGYRRAMIISAVLHGLCVPTFVASGLHAQLGLGYLVGCGIVTVILIAQHSIVHRIGPRAIPMAFFTVNGWTGIALLACTVAGLWLDARL